MNLNKRQYGYDIESHVSEYLVQKDFKIIEMNYTIKGGEIDIIAKDKNTNVFIEVKSLRNEDYIRLEQTISAQKRKALIRTSQVWLKKHSLENSDWRIDFVGVLVDIQGQIQEIRHVLGAIY